MQRELDAFCEKHSVAVLIEGESPGADALARQWAERSGIPVERYHADRERHGARASPLRNSRMLEQGRPDYVLAFPTTTLADSPGTLDMVTRSRAAGVAVRVVSAAG